MARGAARAGAARVPVWDRAVRLLHWLLAGAALACWFTTSGWHEWAGYVAAVAAVARVAWGFGPSPHARFASFLLGPRATARYAAQLARGGEPRYQGHNPLGGWMVVALLAVVLALGATGWLYLNTDAFWGDPVIERMHGVLGWALLALVAVHVTAVLWMGWRHRENLVRAMVDGRKAEVPPSDAA